MAPENPQADNGLILDSQAITERVARRIGYMYDEILGTASQMSLIANGLVREWTIPARDGLQATVFDMTDLVAKEKPEGAETTEQRPEIKEAFQIRLKNWEVRLGLTDEAEIDGAEFSLSPQERLDAGRAGKAFAKAIDYEGLGTLYGGVTPVGATNPWATITDNALLNDLTTAVQTVEDAGFNPDKIMLTRHQMSRIARTNWVIQGNGGVADYLREHFQLTPILVTRVRQRDRLGNFNDQFDPTGQVMIFDSQFFGIFSQRPMVAEVERNASRGINFVYLRKYFKTIVSDAEAAFIFDDVGY